MTETEQEYFQILAWRKLHPLPETEFGVVHHILPKSLGGPNRPWNLIRITPEEHYACHKLLPMIFKEKGMKREYQKMVYAWNFTCKTREGLEVSQEEYGRLQRELAAVTSEIHKGMKHTVEARRKMSESHKGKSPSNKGVPHTKEARRKMSLAAKGKPKSEEFKRTVSETMSKKFETEEHWMNGRTLPEEQRKRISESNKGRKPWNVGLPGTFLGKHHTEESNRKNREAHLGKIQSEETKRKRSESLKRYWEKKKCQSQSQSQH